MFNQIFKNKYKTAHEFMTNAINTSRVPQSLILSGLNPIGQYYFALECARLLNCRKEKAPDCACLNCNWIKDNVHPAVVTISRMDFKVGGDTSTTVISIDQTRELIKTLQTSSDYHRVIIFCDAQIEKYSPSDINSIEEFQNLNFKFPSENWRPYPLTSKNLQAEASNSLLKLLEEPPENVTFIFLTKYKNDLLSTIVSRSFHLNLPDKDGIYDYSFLKEIFIKYPNFDLEDVFPISEQLVAYAKENEITHAYILNALQAYLKDLLKENPNACEKILNDIKLVQNAKKQIDAFITPLNAYEYLLLKLIGK